MEPIGPRINDHNEQRDTHARVVVFSDCESIHTQDVVRLSLCFAHRSGERQRSSRFHQVSTIFSLSRFPSGWGALKACEVWRETTPEKQTLFTSTHVLTTTFDVPPAILQEDQRSRQRSQGQRHHSGDQPVEVRMHVTFRSSRRCMHARCRDRRTVLSFLYIFFSAFLASDVTYRMFPPPSAWK